VVVVMTDGLQSGDHDRPLALGAELRAANVELYGVGLGTDVDAAYLVTLVGAAERVYLSPTPDDLAAIYEQIARLIPCPAASYWGRR
jgi:hypothetical protein